MEAMKDMADNQYDLAIVDPPYGIGNQYNDRWIKEKKHLYDNVRPKSKYFKEVFRVSVNQIIWGGNYYTDDLYENRGWVCWDKKVSNPNYSDFELAWTSFDKTTRFFRYCNAGGFMAKGIDTKIHPTQKPIKLYEWLLMNYAKEGDKILDTHLGSGSIAIACHNLKYDLDAYEIDREYYEATMKRFKNHTSQKQLWT
jgi:site-specific DNA-methyltransferase (adenine-specific)